MFYIRGDVASPLMFIFIYKNKLVKHTLILSSLFIILAIILFDDISLWFLGMGIVTIGIICLYMINH